MKVELKDATVEMEVEDGESALYINGHRIPLTRDVASSLIFGEKSHKVNNKTTPKPGVKKTAPPIVQSTRGCQTDASKAKLSASLKKYWRERKKEEAAKAKKKSGRHLNGIAQLN